ncbi:MAG TPA: NAD-dependent epimerase/dehydratase family protein, partial [Actinomycetota bacterium]|nr:NAD-dependent epimerase/dehydratase family protein [Actinomycetota bacterium]
STVTERVLITGGLGFIGANLVRLLQGRGQDDIVVVDDLRKGRREHLPEGAARVVIGDCGDGEVMAPALEGASTVIHLASETGVQPSVEDPVKDFEGNAATTFRVLEACREAGVERFVFASTGAAAGEVDPPIHEEVVPKPVSPYGAGKLAGEAYCRAYAASFGMRTAALRFSNVYGPWSLHKKWNAVPAFVKRCLTGENLTIYGDGGQTRDFVYVEDLCDAILRAAGSDSAGEVFQIATGIETSIKDLAELVRKVVGADVEIEYGPRREGEVYRTSVDISKAREVLGFEPGVPLEEGVRRTAEWYRENWEPSE